MTPDLANNNIRESNPHNIYKSENSYYHHSANNSTHASLDAFRLLSRRKQLHPDKRLEFDQELCIRLVKAHDLNCSGCLLPCMIHKLEAMK